MPSTPETRGLANAEFFAAHGMSYFARSTDEAARFADRLIYDTSAAARMLRAQDTCLPKDGAEHIAGIICGGSC